MSNSIDNILMFQIISNAVTIIVAFISGWLPTFLSHRNEVSKTRKEKLENFYIEVSNWFDLSITITSSFLYVINGKWSLDNYNEYIINTNRQTNHLASEIDVFIFFPELKENYINLKNSIQKANICINTEMIITYHQTENILLYKEKFLNLIESCNKNFEILQKNIYSIAEKIKQ